MQYNSQVSLIVKKQVAVNARIKAELAFHRRTARFTWKMSNTLSDDDFFRMTRDAFHEKNSHAY